MTFEAALIVELKTITALGGRVYPLNTPESFRNKGTPFVEFSASEGIRMRDLLAYRTGRVVEGEVNLIASDYKTMKSVTPLVIAKMTSMEGRVIGIGGPRIQEFTYRQPVEIYEDLPKLHRCLIDYAVYY